MELPIVTAPEALVLLQEGWSTRALSLVGDDLRFPLESFGAHHLILRFPDVEAELEGLVAPTEELLREGLAHMSGLDRRTGSLSIAMPARAGRQRWLWAS